MGLFEGNYFVDSDTVLDSGYSGVLFASASSDLSDCKTYLGRNCVENSFSNSGTLTGTDTSFFSKFSGKNIPTAASASSIKSSVVSAAGNTL